MTELAFAFYQPSLPLSMNKANTMHWAARRRYMREWRLALRAAFWKAAMERDALPYGHLTISFEFTFPRNGRRDPHNYFATVKPLIDELVLCEVVPDDTAEWVTTTEPVLRVADDNLCVVRMVFTEEAE